MKGLVVLIQELELSNILLYKYGEINYFVCRDLNSTNTYTHNKFPQHEQHCEVSGPTWDMNSFIKSLPAPHRRERSLWKTRGHLAQPHETRKVRIVGRLHRKPLLATDASDAASWQMPIHLNQRTTSDQYCSWSD